MNEETAKLLEWFDEQLTELNYKNGHIKGLEVLKEEIRDLQRG